MLLHEAVCKLMEGIMSCFIFRTRYSKLPAKPSHYLSCSRYVVYSGRFGEGILVIALATTIIG